MAVAPTEIGRSIGRGNNLALIPHVRVSNAVAHFAQTLPFRVRCSDDLGVGLAWAERNVALRHRELAPDPPGWKTALRFDVDCPCDRQPHARSGYCPRAATYWRDAGVAEPSFIVVNPTNGHAHVIYLLRGWVRTDGSSDSDLAAVRYLVAIERAYTRALHADAGYAGLVTHNPFHADFNAVSGRDEPYSLTELAAFVELPRIVYRRAAEIRTNGRNVELFDRLRFWAYAQISEYRCGPRDTWDDVVAAQAIAIAAEVRAAHAAATHPYTDAEALDTGKSVAGWVWLRYVGGSLTRVRAETAARREKRRKRNLLARRERGAVPRDVWLDQAQQRRLAAHKLRGLGVAVAEIARRLSAGVRSVQRWLAELDPLVRSAPGPRPLSDFERLGRPPSAPPEGSQPSSSVSSFSDAAISSPRTPERASIAAAIDGSAVGPPFGTNGTDEQRANDPAGRGVRRETIAPEDRMAYILGRIAAIVKRSRDARPP
jgi:hypothetical protein